MINKNKKQKGRLEVICGPMFSGKTEEQIRRLRRAKFAGKEVIVIKHCLDDRKSIDHIVSHNGSKIKAFALNNALSIKDIISDEISFIGIDEIQLFSHSIINVVIDLVEDGKHVIASGLDLDFRGNPFGCLPTLLSIADSITKLTAICTICGDEAKLSQRLINGHPAKYEDKTIMIGADEVYQARCRNCHKIDRPTTQIINQQHFL